MSGRIPRAFIDDLLNRVDIVEVIDSRVPLKKKGREYWACCPFHGEKTASFSVSAGKQFYHCFGCQKSGNAVGFLMDYDHMEFVEAIESLSQSLGIEVPYEEGETVLAAARRAGLDTPFSCEEGYCSCCMAKVTEGEVKMATNDCLTPDLLEEGWVLTCQARCVSGKVKVEYPD